MSFYFLPSFPFELFQKCDQKYQHFLFFYNFFRQKRKYHRHQNLGSFSKNQKKKRKAISAKENNFFLDIPNFINRDYFQSRDHICEKFFKCLVTRPKVNNFSPNILNSFTYPRRSFLFLILTNILRIK